MSDNIVKHGQLEDIAGDLWTKAKKRDIEKFEYDSSTKTIKGKSDSNANLDIHVELTNLVSIDEKAEFKQDVSSDNVAIINNKHIGTTTGFGSQKRSVGFRKLTTTAFADGYVDHIRIYMKNDIATDTPSTWKVWAITKGVNNKSEDIVGEVIYNTTNLNISSITEGTVNRKLVIIPIKRSFENETYFIVQCTTHELEIVSNVTSEYINDVVNMNHSQPPTTPNTPINWDEGVNNTDNTAIMYLYGRESIGSLSLKLNQVQADGSKYVLKTETTNTGGTGQQGKVVKLGADGKLNTNMLPELAINRVLTAASKSDALNMRGQNANQLQLGDVVVITGEQNKVYMCKDETHAAFENAFIELSIGNGTVKTVNSQTPGADGNVTVNADNIKYANGADKNVKEVLDEKVSNIALHATDKKKLTVTKADGHNEDVNLTEAFKANNIAYNKTIAGENKATVENAIDALVAENGKAVKKVSGCAPDTNGNIVVTANKTDARVALSFGTGGTDVELFSYMTAQEVTEIKNLFV